MTPTLYFLRSSESKIVQDMTNRLYFNMQDNTIYSSFYGLTPKDLGLYALVDNTIAGAIWSRKLNAADGSAAFIDENTPVLSMYVLPAFRNQGIAKAIMEQFLLEAGEVHESLSIQTTQENSVFLEKFGFTLLEESNATIMKKVLTKKEIVRPSDGYDPRRWMD